MSNIYVSTGYKHRDRAIRFAMRAHAEGHTVTCRWWALSARQKEIGWDGIAHHECRGVCLADALIVLLPGGHGTHFEAGLAFRGGARVIIVGAPTDPNQRAQACIFYHAPTVEHAASEDEALAMLGKAAGEGE